MAGEPRASFEGNVRAFRPTDLVALVVFEGRSFPNEAISWDRLTAESVARISLTALLQQWLILDSNRYTAMCMKGQTLLGLASAKKRYGRTAWEVDYLLVCAPAAQKQAIGLELLNNISQEAITKGVERIFIRLPEDGPWLEPVPQVGFRPYAKERLYRLSAVDNGEPTGRSTPPYLLRPQTRADQQPLFQVFSSIVPEGVKTAEGLTLRQWRDSREGGWEGLGKRQLVCEKDGIPVGWLSFRIDGRTAQFRLMAHPEERECLKFMLGYCLTRLKDKAPLLSLAPEYHYSLGQILLENGFEDISQFTTLFKQLVVPVGKARLVIDRPSKAVTSEPVPF